MATTPEAGPTAKARSPERRKQIIEVARAAFLRFGYQGARTGEMAKRIGCNEAIIYRHFGTKRALFDAAVIEPLREFVDNLAGYAAEVIDAPDDSGRLEVTRRVHRELAHSMREMAPLLGVALYSRPQEGLDLYAREIAPLLESLAEATEESQRTWSHREVDIRTLAVATFGMHFAIALDAAAVQSGPAQLDSASREIADLVYRGVRPD